MPTSDDLHSFPTIVMAGLDPAIHGVPLPPASTRNLHGQVTRHPVDARMKPGHDGCKIVTKVNK
jgi:hypothetical protein